MEVIRIEKKESRKLLGAQLMCARASDMVSEFTQAIANGLTMEDGAAILKQLQDCLREHFPVSVPHTTFQQIQTTGWFYLPDGTWLTVLDCGSISQYAWIE